MDLPSPLAWLVDEAGASPGPERFLAELGRRLLAEGLPLSGGALTLSVPHPIIARRTWLASSSPCDSRTISTKRSAKACNSGRPLQRSLSDDPLLVLCI